MQPIRPCWTMLILIILGCGGAGFITAFLTLYIVTSSTAPVVVVDNILDVDVITRNAGHELLQNKLLLVRFRAKRKENCQTVVGYYVSKDTNDESTPKEVAFLSPVVNGINELTPKDERVGIDIKFQLPGFLTPGEWNFSWRASDTCQFIPGLPRLQMRAGKPIPFTLDP